MEFIGESGNNLLLENVELWARKPCRFSFHVKKNQKCQFLKTRKGSTINNVTKVLIERKFPLDWDIVRIPTGALLGEKFMQQGYNQLSLSGHHLYEKYIGSLTLSSNYLTFLSYWPHLFRKKLRKFLNIARLRHLCSREE